MTCTEFADSLLVPGSPMMHLRRFVHGRCCSTCRALADDTRRLASALGRLPRHQTPPEMAARLRAIAHSAEPVTRSPLRGLVWGAVALTLALAALLFAPRLGRRDALAQALDDLRHAETMHFIWRTEPDPSQPPSAAREGRCEFWIAGDDRYRTEWTETRNGKVDAEVAVRNGDRLWQYREAENAVEVTDGLLSSEDPDLAVFVRRPHESLMSELERTHTAATVSRKTSADPDGRPVIVYEYEVRSPGLVSQATATIDAGDGKLLRYVASEADGNGRCRQTVRVDQIEYDIPIPEERFTFTPPPGARVIVRDWWKQRRSQVLGTETAGEWRLTLRSVDLQDNGDILVSVSREALTSALYNESAPPKGRVLDDAGRPYAQLPTFGVDHEHWTLGFTPVEPGATPPGHVTVELNPYPPGSEADPPSHPNPGTVTFDAVPVAALPPGNPFPTRSSSREAEEANERSAREYAVKEYRQQYPR